MAQMINLCVLCRQSRATYCGELPKKINHVKTHPIVGGIDPRIKTFNEQLRFKLNEHRPF